MSIPHGSAVNFTGNITVPAGAVVGPTRLRARLMYSGTVDPCGDATFGEVEDARGDAWGAGWDAAPQGASRAQRADAAKRAQERHDAETLARLRRDVAPGIAAALARWATVRP